MSSRRRKRLPPKPAGAWSWIYAGPTLVGIVQQRPDGLWRAIRVDDGRDRETAICSSRAAALAFINGGARRDGR
jgi:hypothetical protein